MHIASLVLAATRCRPYHLHVEQRELKLMEVRPLVRGFPVTACCWGLCSWAWWCMGLDVMLFATENNSGDLKHERHWIKDVIDHRIHRAPEDLEWGKMGTRENSGDLGGKTNGQTHQGILASVPCPSLVQKRRDSDWQPSLRLYPSRGWSTVLMTGRSGPGWAPAADSPYTASRKALKRAAGNTF